MADDWLHDATRRAKAAAVRYLVADAGIRQFLDIGTRLTMSGPGIRADRPGLRRGSPQTVGQR